MELTPLPKWTSHPRKKEQQRLPTAPDLVVDPGRGGTHERERRTEGRSAAEDGRVALTVSRAAASRRRHTKSTESASRPRMWGLSSTMRLIFLTCPHRELVLHAPCPVASASL